MRELLEAALRRRVDLIAGLPDTDCYRLFHGIAEGHPGLTVDRYGAIILAQTWREPLADVAVLSDVYEQDVVVWDRKAQPDPIEADGVIGTELGLHFDVTPPDQRRGQDPWLFLDFRAARRWVRANAEGARVLNLFAYTCGIGVAAAAGGASEVWNADFARSALNVGRRNAQLNDVSMNFHCEDVLPVLRHLGGVKVGRRRQPSFRRLPVQGPFDGVVLDPPRWSKGKWGAVDVVRDYPSLFKPALLSVKRGGGWVLATNHVPSVSWEDWTDTLQRCAAKANRPLQDLVRIEPEADFPSFDGNHPLKMAVCRT